MTKIIIRTEQHRDRAIAGVRIAPLDYEVVIQKEKKSKTIPQLGYTFGVVYPAIIKFVEESHGESFSSGEMHIWCKKQILGVDHKEIDGEVIEIERELKKSDREKWTKYIDSLISFVYNRWGLIIPAAYYVE
jgi:hypothetical protein